MKKFFLFLYQMLPHITLIMALLLTTLAVTDYFNRAMAFLDNQITKTVFVIFLGLVLIQSISTAIMNRKLLHNKEEKQ